jgi:hypothetical protein
VSAGAASAGAASAGAASAGAAHSTPPGTVHSHLRSLSPKAAANPRPRTVVPGTWSIAPSPNSSISDVFAGVSCVSATFCMSAGYDYSGTHDRTLIEQWNGTTWSIVPSPNTTPTANDELFGVSCVTTSFCIAGGNSNGGGARKTLIEQWNGTTWSIASSPNTSPTVSNQLADVSCTSLSFCVAVGTGRVPVWT